MQNKLSKQCDKRFVIAKPNPNEYRPQCVELWELHDAQRRQFFAWLEVKRCESINSNTGRNKR